MPAPTITTAPAAPLRTEDPATFVTKAEAFVDWMAGAPGEFNALGAYLEALESGTLSAKLAAIDALAWAANKIIYLTGSNTVGSTDLTAFARTLLAAVDAAAARSALGVDTSTLQPLDSDLTAIAALTTTSYGRAFLTLANQAALMGLLDQATQANVRAGTSGKLVMADTLHSAHEILTLTDGATINWDMAAGFNAKVTIANNRTLAISNPKEGLAYTLGVKQDATGSRTMTWPSSFDWGTAGAPTLSTTANKRDRITLYCTDASTPKFDAFLSGKGFS